MVRRSRIVLCSSVLAVAVSGAVWTPAIGDQHLVRGAQQVSYTEDGVPVVHSGPECKAGAVAEKQRDHHQAQSPDPSDY